MTRSAIEGGIAATDLTPVHVGASRQAAEDALGSPVKREHNVYTYEYNKGVKSPLGEAGWAGHPLAVVGGAALDFFTLGLTFPDWIEAYNAQRGRMTIVYGPNDKVVSLSHEFGAVHHKYSLVKPDRRAALRDLCLAANAGYAPAQFDQALRYRYGLWGTEPDPIQANLWLRLAAFGGHADARALTDEWSATLTSDQDGEVDRQYKDWRPSGCEGKAVSTYESAVKEYLRGKGYKLPALTGSFGRAVVQQWKSLCRRAEKGNGDARAALGSHYRYGWEPVKQDLVQAYRWFSLAAQVGYIDAATYQSELAGEMTNEQLVEAERLSTEPKGARCEG